MRLGSFHAAIGQKPFAVLKILQNLNLLLDSELKLLVLTQERFT